MHESFCGLDVYIQQPYIVPVVLLGLAIFHPIFHHFFVFRPPLLPSSSPQN
jgi:hypothetical protein